VDVVGLLLGATVVGLLPPAEGKVFVLVRPAAWLEAGPPTTVPPAAPLPDPTVVEGCVVDEAPLVPVLVVVVPVPDPPPELATGVTPGQVRAKAAAGVTEGGAAAGLAGPGFW
jgi:hypothetical protein